jgi:hypothetical protein
MDRRSREERGEPAAQRVAAGSQSAYRPQAST